MSKCKVYCRKVGNGESKARFKNHVNKCDGTGKKQPKFDKVAKPYCPHITSNKRYRDCLINNKTWYPKTSYLTYDVETVRHIVNEESGSKTQINATLELLSIAYSTNTKQTFYFDRRDDKFMIKFSESIFQSAEVIAEENEDNYVVVFGFNSTKFDNNMILSDLVKSGCKIESMLGPSTQQKQLVISRK